MSQRTLKPPKPQPLRSTPASTRTVHRRAPEHETDDFDREGDFRASVESHDVGTLASGRPTPPPAAPPSPPLPPVGPRRDFTDLYPRAPHNISDQDLARAIITRVLLDELAPRLGLDPSRLSIRVDAAAEAQTNAAGASGLQEGTTILLHPQRYRPGTTFGRYLLAHEAAHAAQRHTLTRIAQEDDGNVVVAAEREADVIARAYAVGAEVRKPAVALVTTTAAAYTGTDDTSTPVVGDADFSGLVRSNHARELSVMTKALSYGVFDWAVTDGDVKDVLRILEAQPFEVQIALVLALEDKFAKRLADNISPVHFKRFRTPILAAYSALLRLPRGVDALHDDPFAGMDFTAITPEEHHALREIIPKFVATERGKHWYAGLKERHLLEHVEDVLSRESSYDETKALGAAAQKERDRQKQLQENAEILKNKKSSVNKFLDEAREKLAYHPTDWAITDGETRSLIDKVAEFASQPSTLRAIVDSLESDNLMDRWVDNIPVDDLYTDKPIIGAPERVSRRKMLLKLLVLRPAWKNSRMAESLLSYGLLDWAITDEDAFLAFQLVKALPERSRASLLADAKYADRLDEEQSRSMKKGRTSNFYTGGEDGKDLRTLKAQLLEDEVWSKEQMTRLRQLMQMARAADEGPWLFAQSKTRFTQMNSTLPALYADADFFARVVQGFGLYIPRGFRRPDGAVDAGREQYVPETVQGKPFGSDNFLATAWRYVRYLASHTGNLKIFGDTKGGTGLDLTEAQRTQGGAVMGVEFATAPQSDRAEQLDNSVMVNMKRGLVDARATRLDIANINYQLASFKIQTGMSVVRGLRVHIEYPTEDSARKATTLRLYLDVLELNDVLLIASDAMRGFEQIRLTDVYIELSPEEEAGNAAVLPEDLASGTAALLKQGFLAPTTPENLTITAAEVLLVGMTTSDGQFISSIKLADVALRSSVAPDTGGYRTWLDSQRKELQMRLGSAISAGMNTKSLTLRLQSIDRELQSLSEAEGDVARLEPLVKSGAASAADVNHLKRAKSYLAGVETGGVALDVGHAEVKGIAGKVTMGDVTLDDVHGWGHSAGAVLGAVSGSTTLSRMLRGPEYRGTLEGVELEGDPMAFVKLGQLQLGAVDVQGDIPTVEDAQKDLDTAVAAARKNPFEPRLADEVERLRTRRANAGIYWSTIEKATANESDRQAFNAARQALLADKAFHVDSLTAKGVVVELSNQSGTTSVGLDTEELEAHGLEARGLRVDTVTGKNLRIGGDIRGGLQTLIGIGKNRDKISGGAISADELRLTGIAHKYSGIKVEEALVQGLDAKATVGDASTIDLAAANIEVTGVNWSLSERVLEMQRSKLLQKPADSLSNAEKTQLANIEGLLDDIKASKESLIDATTHLMNPKLSDVEKQRYEAQKAESETELAFWQKKVELKRLGIKDLNISVTGLGNILGEDYDFDRALSTPEGVTIAGKGPGGQITSGITAEGAWTRLSPGNAKQSPRGMRVTAGGRAGVESLQTGPIRGSINLSNEHVTLNGLEIDSVDLRGFRYFSGDTGIWSNSQQPSHIAKIVVDATMFTPLVDEKKKDGDRYTSQIVINKLSIGEIAGHDIHYQNFKSGLHATLGSGRLIGIDAMGMTVDLPKTDKDALLIRGGLTTIDRTENLRIAARTGSGLALSTTLNAGKIAAEFAKDGKITADLLALTLDAGRLTQKDLDAKFNAKSDFMHFELMPGSKGYENARQKFRLLGGEFSIEGKKGPPLPESGRGPVPTRFGATFKDISTGDIERDPDGTIRAPALQLPKITLDKFHFDNEKFTLDVDKGGPVELLGTTINVVAEANPKPEEARGKDESSFQRIVIRELNIPLVTFSGMFAVFKNAEKGDMIVSLASNSSASLRNVHIGGSDGKSEGFILEPNNNWQMFGKLGVEESTLNGIGADVGSALISNLDANVQNFSVEFLGKDDTKVAFDDLTVTALSANLKDPHIESYYDRTSKDGGRFDQITSTLKRAGFSLSWDAASNRHIHLHKFSMDKSGARLESLDLAGFRYTDPDRTLTLDIRKASIPGGANGMPGLEYVTDEKTHERKVKIPRAEISDAHIDVDDVMKLGGPDGGVDMTPADALTYAPDLGLVDRVSGHVNFTVDPVLRSTGKDLAVSLAGPFKIRIEIVDGKIEFGKMEDQSTGNIADFFVDLDYMNGRVDWDARPVRMLPARLQANIHVPYVDPYWWELDQEEASLARTGFVKLSTLIRHPIQTEPGDPNKPTKAALLKHLFFGDVDVHLTLPGKAHIPLGNAGFIDLGGDDKTPGVTLDVKSRSLPAIETTVPTFEANVSKLDLKLDNEGSKVTTGAISIGGVKDAALQFRTRGVGPVYTDDDGNQTQNQLPVPTNLAGSLTKCSVENIEVTLPPAEKNAQ